MILLQVGVWFGVRSKESADGFPWLMGSKEYIALLMASPD